MPWLEESCSLGIVRAGPAVLVVPGIPQGVVPLLPSRRGRVVTFAREKIHSCHKNMQSYPIPGLIMADGRPRQAIFLKSHGPPEIVQTVVDLLRCWRIFLSKSNHR